MKRLLSFTLVLIMCVSLVACGNNSADDQSVQSQPEIADVVYDLSGGTENLKTHGRTTITESGLVCDASASGIEFNAYVEGDVRLTLDVSAECYFTVYIDGERKEERVMASEGEQTITVATFAEGGVHTIRFLKQSEAQCAICTVKKLEFKGYFCERPADKELLIEFVGDSITVGYGALCPNGTAEHGAAVNQDSTQAYSFLTAESLGADAVLVCYSGIGLSRGWCDFTMDSFYKADSYVRDTEAEFIPDRVPDLVVINLGTNDGSMNSEYAELEESVPELISLIRTAYGKDIPIIWVHGMMGNAKWTEISEILESNFGGEEGGIYTLEIFENREGGATHPILEAHYSASEALVKFIKEKGLDK